jgi:hypothetical protein
MYNFGQSILDFTFSGGSFDSSPSQYFTPYGGRPVQAPTVGAPYTFEGLNQNDFDMAVCGILLFNDPFSTPPTPTGGHVRQSRLRLSADAGQPVWIAHRQVLSRLFRCKRRASRGCFGRPREHLSVWSELCLMRG